MEDADLVRAVRERAGANAVRPLRALLASLVLPLASACPRCTAGDPLVAPGSRHLAAKI